MKRDSSLYSVNERLLKNSNIFDMQDIKETIDNIITKTLIIFTIISIIFLFWVQNSEYHLIEHTKEMLKQNN